MIYLGGVGYIRYIVTVNIQKSNKLLKSFSLAFTVLKTLDLNYESPDLKTPVQLSNSKYFWFWPCKSGPLLFTATLQQTGYVPGQSIPITIDMINNSNVNLDEIVVKLKQKIKYTCEVPHAASKFEEREVVKQKSDGVPKKGRKNTVINVVVPAIPPSNVNMCRVIQINYELVIKAKTTGGTQDLEQLEIPITIGSVPLSSPTTLSAHVNISASAPVDEPEMYGSGYQEMITEHPELSFIRK